jgi:hypothetical protein
MKQPSSNKTTIMEFAWRDSGSHEKPVRTAGVLDQINFQYSSDISLEHHQRTNHVGNPALHRGILQLLVVILTWRTVEVWWGRRLVVRVDGSLQVSLCGFLCQVAVRVYTTDVLWVLAAPVLPQDEAGATGALITARVLQPYQLLGSSQRTSLTWS